MDAFGYYRGKRVLVTGATGFKGRWLVEWLLRLGADVRGLGLPPTPAMDRGWPEAAERCPVEIVDVRDAAATERAVARFRPEAIFHLAAQPLVRESYADPVGTFATNVLGTVHTLEAARRTDSVRVFVNVTTDKCYENREWHWGYREDEPLGGHDPYAASKACSELVTRSYRLSFADDSGLRIASARAGNVIGGGDWAADRLIPDLVKAIQAGRPVVLRRPEAIRPWQHVLEPLSGYLLLGQALAERGERYCDAWNFGPIDVEPLTVREVARHFVAAWGEGTIVEQPDVPAVHEAAFLKLDSSKAVAELGWRPLLTVPERLAWTAEWYREQRQAPAATFRLVDEQIERFERRAAGPGGFRLPTHRAAPVPTPHLRVRAA